MQSQTITAFFDNRADAESAIQTLTNAGITADSIRMIEGADAEMSAKPAAQEDKGFFASLGDFFMPDDDRQSYAEGLRRGGYLVSVQAASDDIDRVVDILDADGSVDMDARTESWRSEGWAGATAGTAAVIPTQPAMTGGRDGTSMGEGDGTIEVVEEQIRIGKRDVSHGRVRVRAYTVEDQVSEDVTLRHERVDIVRRPVDRVLTDTETAFTDRTLEVEETAEEAVVSKTARVTEEIDVAKTIENVTETVSGAVRRTEVEIEDDRKAKFDPVK